MFNKVCIIGCGLIGSSLARAIKKKNLAKQVVSSNRSAEVNKKVIALKIVDDASSDTKKMVENSDLIIIAAPLSSYEEIILKIKNTLKNNNAILTDVGSVKENILSLVEKNIPENVSWIPSHPIAGTEESGPESGFSELFKDRWCILTPSKKANEKDINFLKTFWEKIGSKVDIMEAKQHDYILSVTSHIPHLIAYNIVNTSLNIQEEKKFDIVKYSAGGLRDFTRIAASNPIMWRDIFIENKDNTSQMIEEFIKNLKDLKKAIENKDGKKLEKIFTKTKKIRKDIIEAGQDVEKPNFGRK